jgi:transcriptional regulator with XRE-family HTH domain
MADVLGGDSFVIEQLLEGDEEQQAFYEQSAALYAGDLIRSMREFAGLSQRDLARRVGTSQPHISDLERGAGLQGPTFLMLHRIAVACDVLFRVQVSPRAQEGPPPGAYSLREVPSLKETLSVGAK